MSDTPQSDLPDIIARLQAIQKRLGESGNRFAQRLNISASAWSRIQNVDEKGKSKYGAANKDVIIGKLRSALALMEDKHEALSQRVGGSKILKLSMVVEALNAVSLALAEPRDRAVVILAPTGGGKTQISKALQEHYGTRATLVEAGVSWDARMEVVRGFALALGLEMPGRFGTGVSAVTAAMQGSPRIFVIDEGHNIGREGINLIKQWMNTTECVFVLLAVPRLWMQICGRWGQEAGQLRSRVCVHLQGNQVKPEDVKLFLGARLPRFAELNGSAGRAIDVVKRAADAFGLWDTVERITTAVSLDAGDDELTLNMFTDAVAEVERLRAA